MKNITERFWSKVEPDKGDECREWTGGTNNEGYGSFRLMGRTARAHRLAYAMANGRIPKGLCVLHSCDNPPCVNPRHLSLGTKAENNAQKISRGRHKTKLTVSDVLKIRVPDGRTLEQVGAEFGVSETTIREVRTGKTWAHIESPEVSA